MSIHLEILELIQASVDGLATEAEQVKLRDAMARDAAVRDEYRSHLGLSDLLAQVGPEAPPAQLVPNVMRGVRAREGATHVGLAGRIRAAWPGSRMAVRYAYAVAAGVVIGVVGLHLASGGRLTDPAFPESGAGATIGASGVSGRLDLAPAGVRGVATLRPSPSGTAIGVELNAAEPVEFILSYDPAKDGGCVKVVVVRGGETTEVGALKLPETN